MGRNSMAAKWQCQAGFARVACDRGRIVECINGRPGDLLTGRQV